MTVCEEDTIHEIRFKYNKLFNAHSGSYTWRKIFRNVCETFYIYLKNVCVINDFNKERCGFSSGKLNFNHTLSGNGFSVGLNSPAIWLFYEDDFTSS